MSRLDNIIRECVERYLLKESYIGDLYHFTSIGLAYDIMNDNIIYSREDSSQGHIDRRMRNVYGSEKVISLSRSGTFGDGFEKNYGISIRFTIDGEKLLTIGKVLPYYYSGFPEWIKNPDFDFDNPDDNPPSIKQNGESVTQYDEKSKQYKSTSEFEERFYGNNIYPLDKYCKRVDILIRDISATDDSDILSDTDYDYVPTYNFGNKKQNALVNKQLIDELINMPRWKGKVFIHYKNKPTLSQFEIKNKQ